MHPLSHPTCLLASSLPQDLYARLLGPSKAAPCDLSFQERMAACGRLAELLAQAAGRWGLAGGPAAPAASGELGT